MKSYAKLRGRMAEMEVTSEDLANYIGRSKTYISNRMTHNYSWTIDEVYKILEYLELSQSEIFVYFPPNGGATKRSGAKR